MFGQHNDQRNPTEWMVSQYSHALLRIKHFLLWRWHDIALSFWRDRERKSFKELAQGLWRLGKSRTSRTRVYSSRNKTMTLPWWKWSRVIGLPVGSWSVTLRHGAVSGTPCWSLLLADWMLGRGRSRVGRGEQKSTFLSPCIPPSGHYGHSVHDPIGWWLSGWGKRLTGIYRIGHPIYLIIKIFLCWGHSLVSTYMGHRDLHVFAHFRHIFPRLPCHQFSNNVPSKSLPDHPGHRPQISIQPTPDQGHCSKFCSLGWFPFTTVLQERSRKWL